MKWIYFLGFIFFINIAKAQNKVENLIIITTDGFRWQEMFEGMEKSIAADPHYNQNDSAYLFKKYWSEDVTERRKKLLPFIWNTIASKGQIYGNRNLGNKVNNANPYWFSYPGYSEIMCGFVDTAINSNKYHRNPNTNVLEFLNRQTNLAGKVAVFGAWDAFSRILNASRSNLPIVNAFDNCGGKEPNANEKLINAMLKDSYRAFDEEECLDVFTHYEALEYLKTRAPKVLYIAYGETDEWAHAKKYEAYLESAHQVDAWIKEIWEFVQSDPRYKNKTALLLTTDHGRGGNMKEKWASHGQSIENSNQIWFAIMGPGIEVSGERKEKIQLYQEQFAQTIAKLLGYTFTAEHPIAEEIKSVIK